MQVILLGTGYPRPDPDRAGPAMAVIVGEKIFIVDAGRGVTQRLWATGLPLKYIRAVFLTHLHSDHVSGLPDLFNTSWIFGRYAPLELYGPEGTHELAQSMLDFFAVDTPIRRDLTEMHPGAGATVNTHLLEEGVVYEDADLRVTAFRVDHQPVEHAFGFRFDLLASSQAMRSQVGIERGGRRPGRTGGEMSSGGPASPGKRPGGAGGESEVRLQGAQGGCSPGRAGRYAAASAASSKGERPGRVGGEESSESGTPVGEDRLGRVGSSSASCVSSASSASFLSSVIISGDTRPSDNLIRHAKGADLLIHEAYLPEHFDQHDTPEVAARLKAYHTSAVEVGQVAQQAGVPTLVLTHLVPGDPDSEKIFLERARQHYKGEIIVGADLMRF